MHRVSLAEGGWWVSLSLYPPYITQATLADQLLGYVVPTLVRGNDKIFYLLG
ncbi:hypothetical protein THIOM_002119 [Candidatus Thiomargarita nelsonii]|uniref:Uncharacterized protein n=1 Tax=Candidatus Thiomargarita nelsonii TaxID=1003181 RepID=A0A176S2B9_9GAMM|nr:hypothetical protein THIOM_002119 [Candidatus Thiomargarita nelsonii]